MEANRDDYELFTPVQMAELLGVSTGTLAVWRCTKRYPLPYIKIGRSVRYSRAQSQKFIISRTVVI